MDDVSKTTTCEECGFPIEACNQIARLKMKLKRAASRIDGILSGRHAGWDQAMAALRDELREEISNG